MTDGLPEVAPEPSEDGLLFGPELLTADEAARLLERGPGRLVVLMGEQGSGKTTVCVELYERQRRRGATALFAGSWTLLAFEALAAQRRAHGMVAPATSNTVDPDGRDILHLALSSGQEPLHLLLGDLPGEVYRRLADNQLDASQIPWLGRADRLLLLVDGARLRDADTRATTLTRVRQLAERIDGFPLSSAGRGVAVLVTKWDLVREDPATVSYWEAREAELVAGLRSLDPAATALRVAAHTDPQEDGLAALRNWLLEMPTTMVSTPLAAPAAAGPEASNPPASSAASTGSPTETPSFALRPEPTQPPPATSAHVSTPLALAEPAVSPVPVETPSFALPPQPAQQPPVTPAEATLDWGSAPGEPAAAADRPASELFEWPGEPSARSWLPWRWWRRR